MALSLQYWCCLLTLAYFLCSSKHSQICVYPLHLAQFHRDSKTFCEDIYHNRQPYIMTPSPQNQRHLLTLTYLHTLFNMTFFFKLLISISQRLKEFLERNFLHPYIITFTPQCQSCLKTLTYFSGLVEQNQTYTCALC